MQHPHDRNYARIARAIEYIKTHYRQQPTLDDMAAAVHMSRYHFQRVFSEWAGLSPKKFVRYLSVEYAKQRLRESDDSLLQTAYETGLSGSGRLHDLFVSIEGMTPAEYRDGGKALRINHGFIASPFGRLLVAATGKGICHLSFVDDATDSLSGLQARFPNAELCKDEDRFQQQLRGVLRRDWEGVVSLPLHLQGTPFQLKVWQALLGIASGSLASYGQFAQGIGKPGAARSVASAIAANQVALLIPCHRVIQAGGGAGGYRWGEVRKSAIIGWEAAQLDQS